MTTESHAHGHVPKQSAAVFVGDWLVIAMLLSLAAFLGFSHLDGRVPFFVAPAYLWMTPATAVVLFAMAAACLVTRAVARGRNRGESCDCHGQGASWAWQAVCAAILIVPIVFGLTVNPRRFSPEGLRKRRLAEPPRDVELERAVAWVLGQTSESRTEVGEATALPNNPTVLDILAVSRVDDSASLEGRFVTLVGQCDLLGDPGSQRFDLYRLVVTCCIADASAVSIEVARPTKQPLEPGSWIRAAGILKYDNALDPLLPVLHAATVSRIPPPSEPYL